MYRRKALCPKLLSVPSKINVFHIFLPKNFFEKQKKNIWLLSCENYCRIIRNRDEGNNEN